MYRFSWSYIKEKWADAGFQKYFKNTGWLFAAQIFSMGASFIATIIIARKLGPGNFGQLSYAVSFISIFSILATLGIDNILYRDLIKHPEKKKEYLGTALTIKLIASFITAILVCIFAFYFGQDDVSKILIAILSIGLIFNAFQIINFEFQAQVKSKYPSIISCIANFTVNALEVMVILTGRGVIYLAIVATFGSILSAILYWYFYEKKIEGKLFSWKFDKNIAKNLLRDSWPLIFTGGFTLVYARIDQVLIKNMLGASQVGIYGVAVILAEVWNFIPGILVSSFFPAIINAKKTSEEIYYARLKKLSLLLLSLAIIISLSMTVLSSFFIHLIYGQAFMGASIILQIYVWSSVGTFLGVLASNYLITENNQKTLIFMTFIPMVINVILNIWWIPKYGIVGSAYATLISYSFGPLTLLLFKKTRGDIKKIFMAKNYQLSIADKK
jgi:O-antigen/teichoic acid export membrane protein